jgi:flagellar assembly protein FliH
MSSKVLPDDESHQVSRVAWRQVAGAAGSGRAASTPGPTEPRREDPAENAATLERLRRECEQRVAEARASGLREGEAAGRKSAADEARPVLERMAKAIDEIASLRPRLRREAEADLVKLAIAIARRVIRREVAIDPEALHGLVLAAFEKLQAREICRVRAHPSQAAALAALLRQRAGGAPIEVVPDPSGDPGSAVFETERGNVDASVETQLGEIERGLADVLRRQR